MKMTEIAAVCVVLLTFAASAYFYGQMPDVMASHWNERGEVDGYMPKFWALFLVPAVSAIMFLLLVSVPKIDPLKANVAKFRKHYDRFIVLMLTFMLYIHLLTILWGAGTSFNIVQAMSPAFGILFYYCGILVANAKQNWFIGIRTPWTMSSENVWDKTHRLGGRLFRAAGIIAFLGILVPDYAIMIVIAPAMVFMTYAVVYSYLEHQKLQRGK